MKAFFFLYNWPNKYYAHIGKTRRNKWEQFRFFFLKSKRNKRALFTKNMIFFGKKFLLQIWPLWVWKAHVFFFFYFKI